MTRLVPSSTAIAKAFLTALNVIPPRYPGLRWDLACDPPMYETRHRLASSSRSLGRFVGVLSGMVG